MSTEDLQQTKQPIEDQSGQDDRQSDRVRASKVFEAIGLFFLELIKVAILAAVTVGLVRYFIFKPFSVQGQSMESNFHEKDYLIIDELTYRFREPQRGEVLVFRSPTKPDDFYLKRVIALPGERVTLESSKIVIYNDQHPQGIVLDEPYLDVGTITEGQESLTLQEDQYYVLGDNREESFDSRRFGPIDVDAIVGRALLRGYPLTRFGTVQKPEYAPLES